MTPRSDESAARVTCGMPHAPALGPAIPASAVRRRLIAIGTSVLRSRQAARSLAEVARRRRGRSRRHPLLRLSCSFGSGRSAYERVATLDRK
jgi:hypothetical protein